MPRTREPKPRRLTEALVQKGLRVQSTGHHAPGRTGMLTGVIDHGYRRPRVEVIPEGLSLGRLDTWAIDDTLILPLSQQFRSLGGSFEAPRGYPLIIKTNQP
jgi:hypothetical protein